MNLEASRTMEVATLGRPFSLGMLYDCRQDSLVPGMTLWDCNDLQNDTTERQQPYSDFEIVTSESTEGKCSTLNVEASLKASLLGGLVQVGGSAKYLNDQKTSKNQARVTLTYKTTTKFQELSMNQLGTKNIKYHHVFETGIATHVVAGILYGAQAFFIFDREVSKQENCQDIQGNMAVMIKKIPYLSIEGDGSLKMEDKDMANVEKFSCKFYGDFYLEKNPVSFQDAVEIYQSLPTLLGENGENAVPLRVWLLPLTVLDSRAAKLVCEISVGLVQDAQNVLENLSDLEIKYNDLMRTTTVQHFPQIGKKLRSFKEMLSEFKLIFQKMLSKKLPSIRGGGEEEAELAEILRNRHSSPFNSKDLHEWMDCKEREIYTVQSFTNMMKQTKIIPSLNDLYKESDGVEHTLCFVFTSLGSAEPYISALSNYLRGIKSDSSQDPYNHDVEREQWCTSKKIADEVREKTKLFCDFAESNKEKENIKFLVVAHTNMTQRGAAIYLYESGFSVSENFEPPSKPETVTACHIKHNSVTLKISPPRYGVKSITSYLVEFFLCGKDEWQKQTSPRPVSVSEEVTVSDLRPNTEYKFRCRAVTSLGVGPANEASTSIKTLPDRSAGEKLKCRSQMISPGIPPVYQVPLTKARINIPGCQKYTFGEENMKPNRTIMLLGATGSGKSTLINAMMNYIVGVDWNDNYRFRLINEDQRESQAHSQTSEVTVYQLNHQDGFKTDFSLTILDTPGFGDTRGIKRDMMITEQIRTLFTAEHGVLEIDAVCVVAQAALARLTPTQRYVFDSVLSIFGADVAENIRLLVTFADGQQPPVLEAINESGVPCPKTDKGLPVHFMFNNSAIFADNTNSGTFVEMFWKMGTLSMKNFFDALQVIDTKSLKLTKEVLRERKELEETVEELQKQVQIKVSKLSEIKETTEKIKQFEAEINRNKNFEFEVTIMKPIQIPVCDPKYFITNCQVCNYTCHRLCSRANDEDKKLCKVMGPLGNCTMCEKKCIWSVHFNQKYRWEYKPVKEKTTVNNLKEKYLKAKEEKKPVQALVKKMKSEYDGVEKEMFELVKKSTKSLNRLKEIALKANPLSTPEYIDILVEGEQREAQEGWKERIKSLLEIRKKAECIVKIVKGEKL